MENDDDLDQMVDTAPTYLSERVANLSDTVGDKSILSRTDRNARSRSIARVPPLSIAVQQEPTVTKQKAEATTQIEKVISKKMNNGVVKKLKTEEVSFFFFVQMCRVQFSKHVIHFCCCFFVYSHQWTLFLVYRVITAASIHFTRFTGPLCNHHRHRNITFNAAAFLAATFPTTVSTALYS